MLCTNAAYSVGGVGPHIAGTELARQLLAFIVGQIGDDHFRARGIQPANGGLAKPAGTADYKRGATTDLHTVPLLATRTLVLRE